jgi:hypothetical protein
MGMNKIRRQGDEGPFDLSTSCFDIVIMRVYIEVRDRESDRRTRRRMDRAGVETKSIAIPIFWSIARSSPSPNVSTSTLCPNGCVYMSLDSHWTHWSHSCQLVIVPSLAIDLKFRRLSLSFLPPTRSSSSTQIHPITTAQPHTVKPYAHAVQRRTTPTSSRAHLSHPSPVVLWARK